MPPKTCTCIVCGQEVSKRKSLKIGEGRACRHHKEVEDFIENAKADRMFKENMASIQDMMLVEQVRMSRAIHPLLNFQLERNLRKSVGEQRAAKILAEADAKGLFTEKEMTNAVAAAIVMKQKGWVK